MLKEATAQAPFDEKNRGDELKRIFERLSEKQKEKVYNVAKCAELFDAYNARAAV